MSKGHAGSSSSWERCCSSSFPRSRTPPEGTRSPAIRHRPTTPTRVAGCCWPTAPAGSTWAADRRRAHRPPRHLHVESKPQPVPLRLRHRRRRPVPVARALTHHLRVRRLPDSPLPERLEPLFAVAAALARGPQRRQHRQPLQLPRQLAGDLWHADEDEAQGRPLLQPRLEWDQPHRRGGPRPPSDSPRRHEGLVPLHHERPPEVGGVHTSLRLGLRGGLEGAACVRAVGSSAGPEPDSLLALWLRRDRARSASCPAGR